MSPTLLVTSSYTDSLIDFVYLEYYVYASTKASLSKQLFILECKEWQGRNGTYDDNFIKKKLHTIHNYRYNSKKQLNTNSNFWK